MIESDVAGTDEEASAFSTDTATVLRNLRQQVAILFAEVAGGVLKSRDVQKALGVDARLSWQIFKLAGPGDVMSLAAHVPSATSMRRLLTAARAHGIAAAKVEAVRQAFDRFEALVATHAGDRTSFDSMARGLIDRAGGSQSDLFHRKAIFKGLSHYYGAQTQVLVVSQIVYPSQTQSQTQSQTPSQTPSQPQRQTPELFDVAHLRCRLGQRRLRSDADAVIDTVRATSPNGDAGSLSWSYFDEPAARFYGAPVLPEFCTQPLPRMVTTHGPDGTGITSLVGDEVGRRSSVNMVFGQLLRGVPITQKAPHEKAGFGAQVAVTTPTELLIFDLLVHQPSFPELALESAIYAYGSTPELHARHPTLKLPFSERPACLGTGPDAMLTREVPRYTDMVAYICRQQHWDPAELALYRFRIEYPILDTLPSMSAVINSPA